MSAIINPYVFGAFDPGETGDLSMWISGDDSLLSGLSDGDPVGGATPWTDRVTGTRTWTNPTEGNRPNFKNTSGPNGKPYIRFVAASSHFLEFSVAGSNIFTASAWTMFWVIKPDSNGVALGTEGGANIIHNNGFIGLCLFDSGGSVNKFRHYRFDGGYTGVDSTTTYSTGTWYIVEAWYDGTDLHIKVNNDTEATVAASNPSSLTNIPRMCRNTSFSGDIAEGLIYNVSKSSGDRTTIRNGLATKYAITLP